MKKFFKVLGIIVASLVAILVGFGMYVSVFVTPIYEKAACLQKEMMSKEFVANMMLNNPGYEMDIDNPIGEGTMKIRVNPFKGQSKEYEEDIRVAKKNFNDYIKKHNIDPSAIWLYQCK